MPIFISTHGPRARTARVWIEQGKKQEMKQGQSVVVTGCAGFIGSHVAQRLLAMGINVVGIDNFDLFYSLGDKRRNLHDATSAATATSSVSATSSLTKGSFTLHEADIADAAAMNTIFNSCDPACVIHLAAKAGVRPSIADPVGYTIANVVGTSSILEASRKAMKRTKLAFPIVVASSSSVYGNATVAPFTETQDVSEPISPYAATKRACELLGHTHWKLTGQPVSMLRFFTVFGERQRPDLAIAAFMHRIAIGEPINVFGDGSMTRDFTYVGDTVDGVLAACEATPRFGYRIWNLGHDHPLRLDEMVRTIEAAVGKQAKINRLPDQPGDVRQTWADLSRSRAEIGYAPKISFVEGVARQWAWYKATK